MSTSIGTQMQENQVRAFKAIAYTLGIIVYLGGVAYAEARAYALFARTIDPELMPVAIIGIVALGLTALSAPLAHHFGTTPGVQRIFLDVFYAFDIFAMAANAVLDAALHTSDNLTTLLAFWSAYVLPALPLACLLGWTIFFMLDPSHRRRDTILAARAATEEVLTSRVIEQMKAADLTDVVDTAARAAAAEIVGQTVGNSGTLPRSPSPAVLPQTAQPSTSAMIQSPAAVPKPATARTRPAKNGRGPEVVEAADPNP